MANSTWSRARLLSAAVMIGLAAASDPAEAQRNAVDATIRGEVLDEVGGRPIPGARVELLDMRDRIQRTAQSDSLGVFVLTRVRPGPFRLRVASNGFVRTRTPQWQVESGEVLTVVVRMDADVVLLAPLEVTARIITQSPVLAGFEARLKRRIGGHVLGREDIEARNPTRVTDLLQQMPGVRVQNTSSSTGAMSSRLVTIGRAIPGAGGGPNGCPVQVYLDGVLASRGGQNVSPDELASPAALEGIEVYGGLASVPAEFLTPDSRCGVIALWTRRSR